MRYVVIFVAAAAVAALAFAASQNARKYSIDNNLTLDDSMSDGTPSVPCKSEALANAIRVKCPSHSSWQTVAVNGEGALTCPATDSGIHWRDNIDDDTGSHWTIDWQCGLDAPGVSPQAVRSEQTVTITGNLSLCATNSITLSPTCSYFSADGTDKPRKDS